MTSEVAPADHHHLLYSFLPQQQQRLVVALACDEETSHTPTTLPTRYPLITAIGLSFTVFFEIPAAWHVSTTCVTSLYDSGASSMTSLGLATRIEMPFVLSPSSTSSYSSFFRLLLRLRARPAPWQVLRCGRAGRRGGEVSVETGRRGPEGRKLLRQGLRTR